MNLVGNAIKFTDAGSVVVSIDVERRASATPSLSIEVADSGSGMTPGEIAELFKPFSRPSRRSEKLLGGTGLGLAISRRLAEMLGGSISVESFPHQGSRFLLLLPLGTVDHVTWISELPGQPSDRFRNPTESSRSLEAKILLAEDNPDIQRVMGLQLQRLGATVWTAKNGQEALDLAAAASDSLEPFDVVLMDMHMPVLDGYEATRLLRARGFRGSIIALTAYAMAEDRDECLRLGCNEHISKPVDWERLSEVLAQQSRRDPA